MIAEILFLVIHHLSDNDTSPSKLSVVGSELIIIVVVACMFTHLNAVRIITRLTFDILVLAALYHYNISLSYTLSIFLALQTLEKLCISDQHTAFFGAIIIFLLPIYIFYYGYTLVHLHYVLVLPKLADLILPLNPYL